MLEEKLKKISELDYSKREYYIKLYITFRDQIKDLSVMENYLKSYNISMKSIEQNLKHYEYHMKTKIDNDSIIDFLRFYNNTYTIKAKDANDFIIKLYEKELSRTKLFNKHKVEDVWKVIDCDKAFENLCEYYYISVFKIDNNTNEVLYTTKK